MTDLRFPVGRFERPTEITTELRARWVADIAAAPARLRDAVAGLTDEQLDTPYRPEGWTVRQVTHHLADSHMNSFTRFKLALTEAEPTIKPYDEKAWADLPDTSGIVEDSIVILEGLHSRWVKLLKRLTDADFERKFRHPESGIMSLSFALGIYAWHSRHHVGHITALRERMGW